MTTIDSIDPPMTTDDENSATIGIYTRDGLTWAVNTRATAGASVAQIDAIDDGAVGGHVDATFIPSGDNDSTDDVVVTITLGRTG